MHTLTVCSSCSQCNTVHVRSLKVCLLEISVSRRVKIHYLYGTVIGAKNASVLYRPGCQYVGESVMVSMLHCTCTCTNTIILHANNDIIMSSSQVSR